MDSPRPPKREAWLAQAQAFWRARKSGMTAVRRLICETVVEKADTFSADALWQECRRQDGLIALATIYRTLRHLVEAGLLAELEGPDDKRLYVVRHQGHAGECYLQCTDCEQVFPIDNPCLALREGEVARRHGFSPKRLSLRIDSTCDEWRDTGKCARVAVSRRESSKWNGGRLG